VPDLTAGAAAILVTGIPGAGKTTVARALAQRFARAAHIEVEQREKLGGLGLWIDSAGQSPDGAVDAIVRGLS
jgi:broad-specificity NMP kinase